MTENTFFNRFRSTTTVSIPPLTMPEGESDGDDGDIEDLELPVEVPDIAPELTQDDILAGLAARDEITLKLRAQSGGCTATVRAELGQVNLRQGPRADFAVVAKANGGANFLVIGASERDPDGFRWFQVAAGSRAQGWLRGDLIQLSGKCAELPYIEATDITPPPPPAPPVDTTGDDRFEAPTPHRVTQGFRASNHKGYDLASPVGSPLVAPQAGLVIRMLRCQHCTDEKPNFTPPCDSIYNDASWGFGYGNAITVRYDYAALPKTLRDEMDKNSLSKGFAYVMLAHMSEVFVTLGQAFAAGTLLGKTGNVGCSTGPHLHFEVKIGKDENVDGKWQRQIPVDPKLMFKY